MNHPPSSATATARPSEPPRSRGSATPNSAPQPPVSIELLIDGALPRRYSRKGSGEDAETAVVGKGGFGTTYLYQRDSSFTPESSCEISAPNSNRTTPEGSPASISDTTMEFLPRLYGETGSLPFDPTIRSDACKGPYEVTVGWQLDRNTRQGSSHHLRAQALHRHATSSLDVSAMPESIRPYVGTRKSASPSVVVVKMCRTPCTGSFDELQKTSAMERKKRKAMMQDPTLSHIRVVRGEGRILRYLQAAREVERSDKEEPKLVRLLADLPAHGKQRAATFGSDSEYRGAGRAGCPIVSIEIEPDFSDGPPIRLLVFERLVEIDAKLDNNNVLLTVAGVEQMALEIIQGLKFLHRHNVTHGDLKPSNLMKDPATGQVKIIDLGASRRFVEVSNLYRDHPYAVDEGDQRQFKEGLARPTLRSDQCEGLSSLTGSPHYMAPEILLQASRYADHKGRARSVLEDWEPHYTRFFTATEARNFEIALSDMKRGWGIRADLWSWSRTVCSLFLKTVPAEERPSSASLCPFDFSFSKHQDDFVEALHQPSQEEQEQPRFHLWSRHFPLYIVGRTLEGIELPDCSKSASAELQEMLKACLTHQDRRPNAEAIYSRLIEGRSAALPTPSQHDGSPNSRRPNLDWELPEMVESIVTPSLMPPRSWSSPSMRQSVRSPAPFDQPAQRRGRFVQSPASTVHSLLASPGALQEAERKHHPADKDAVENGSERYRPAMPSSVWRQKVASEGSLLFADLSQPLPRAEPRRPDRRSALELFPDGSRQLSGSLSEQHWPGHETSVRPLYVDRLHEAREDSVHRALGYGFDMVSPSSVYHRPGSARSTEMINASESSPLRPGTARTRCHSTRTAYYTMTDDGGSSSASILGPGYGTIGSPRLSAGGRNVSWNSAHDAGPEEANGIESRGGQDAWIGSRPFPLPSDQSTSSVKPRKALSRLLNWARPYRKVAAREYGGSRYL